VFHFGTSDLSYVLTGKHMERVLLEHIIVAKLLKKLFALTKSEDSLLYHAYRPSHTSLLNIILVLSFHRVVCLLSGLLRWGYLLQFCTPGFKLSKFEAIYDVLLDFFLFC
jgi:hypothetical protein